jgi:ribosomal protein S21
MSKKKSIVSVKVIKGDINRALKKLKRKTIDSGHLLELRERRYYIKPTTVRRRQKQLAVREQEKETILGKIEDGDTKLRFYTKKPKRKGNKNDKNKNKDKKDK